MSSPRSVYHFNSAIVREPSHSVVDGLRVGEHASPTYEGVKLEHDAYIAAMRQAGVQVTILPALEAFPDSVFVEDPALVFTEGGSYFVLVRQAALARQQQSCLPCATCSRPSSISLVMDTWTAAMF